MAEPPPIQRHGYGIDSRPTPGNLFAMGWSMALSKGYYLIQKTGYENNLFIKQDDLF